MKSISFFLLILVLVSCRKSEEGVLRVPGLEESVEVVRDPYGINHIYAQNQADLFFAQGYLAAQDRLFQFEVWRRQATGTVAEILGESELKRDIGTRLFKYRGSMSEEMGYYHEDGIEIIEAYTQGVNAYIEQVLASPESLPLEFKALGILPEKWTPEVVISRHQGLLGNIQEELEVGRAVAQLGPEAVKSLLWFHPKTPDLTLQDGIDKEGLFEDILGLYEAYRKPVTFRAEHVLEAYRSTPVETALLQSAVPNLPNQETVREDSLSIGSNNWVVAGAKMANGKPLMANDPHRRIAVPSLRYMVHLVAPGWNVIGGGEPEIPGVSIGHNGFGAWGLTVFETDGEDLYVYDTHPDNPNQYRYQGQWEEMEVVEERIPVKGQDPYTATLKYSRHGPVVFEDTLRHKAYAVRCAWMEPGGAPYLASLRMDQADSWESFREACTYSHIPGENMIWADTDGDIGWQAVGIAPVRKNFSGLVPVPGDGRFEWADYLPIAQKPHELNPDRQFIATANENVTPDSYTNWDAIAYSWADPFRGRRIQEVLSENTPLTLEEMQELQTDYHSLPARELVPYLNTHVLSGRAAKARDYFADWDYNLDPKSIPAAIYVAWENEIRKEGHTRFVPAEAREIIRSLQLERILQWIREPESVFGKASNRDAFLQDTFNSAVEGLTRRLGEDMAQWQYGQKALKHTAMTHPLSDALSGEFKKGLDLGPLPRGGNGYTPGSTGNNYRQSSGASFRVIIPVGEWDKALGMNSPGQSGNAESPYYSNLFQKWAEDEYFPMLYSKDSILKYADTREVLLPE
jgi:penicillin amidase